MNWRQEIQNTIIDLNLSYRKFSRLTGIVYSELNCIVKGKRNLSVSSAVKLERFAYHKEIYNGHERMKIVGIREHTIELKGDYSGGTHNVCQKEWFYTDGLIFNSELANEI